jgi:hypothetical protein
MGDDDDVALLSIAQPTAYPACPFLEGRVRRGVETFFRTPVRRKQGEVES